MFIALMCDQLLESSLEITFQAHSAYNFTFMRFFALFYEFDMIIFCL